MHRNIRSGAVGGFVMLCLLWASTQTHAADFFEMCKSGTPEQVAAAIKAGADVNAKNEVGGTPLMVAAGRTNNPEVIAALLKAGADVNAKYMDGRTPLMYAARENKNPEVIAALVKAGADVNAKAKGQTALDMARESDNTRAVTELIKAGAK